MRRVAPLAAGLAALGGFGGAVALAAPAGAVGTTWYVAQGGTSATCSSPTDACGTITAALAVASSGDTIETSGTIDDNVTVSTSVTIAQLPGAAPTIVDGGGLSSVFVVDLGAALSLEGITVENGNNFEGGGIDNDSGTVTVVDSTITDNTTLVGMGLGGGLFNNGGTVSVSNSTIAGNSAPDGYGGGIFDDGGTMTVADSTISGNSAHQGAALVADGSTTLVGDIVGAGAGSECFILPTDGGYNVDDDGTCGFSSANHSVSDSTTIDGYLGSLTANGGDTPTVALLPGTPASPNPAQAAIPAGFTAPAQTTPSCSQPDQRGVARGAPCDIGSFALSTPPSITSAPATAFVAGAPGSFAVTASGDPTPSFSEVGALPPGVSLSAGGSLGGTPAVGSAGSYPITLHATNGIAPDATQAFTLTVTGSAASVGGARLAATPDGTGYWISGADGAIASFGTATGHGSMGGQPLNAPVVGMAATPDGGGYWEVGADGGIFAFGDASFHGSMGGRPLNQPIVGIAAAHDGAGYWEVAADGGIFAFGDAAFDGSMGGRPLNAPIVGMAATPDGGGYWEVAADGGIFAFGDASFHGSTGSLTLSKPVLGVASTSDGAGYWLVAADGGIFAFGDAAFDGSGAASGTTAIGMIGLRAGYSIIAADGTRTNFAVAT
ncbi:MAG TPA: putative Ig domain-containing protein [Acidimicrobiales bacterium]